MDLEKGIYSQGRGEGEQGAILEYFGDTIGTFLDMGAWTGLEFSNTRKLVELGWKGLMIEASPYNFHILRENLDEYHPDVQFLCTAMAAEGAHPPVIGFYETADAVSTSSDKNMEVWKETKHNDEFQSGKFRMIHVSTTLYKTLINQFGGHWDFVNIDTEGSSGAIFMDVIRHSKTAGWPKVICVEHDGNVIELGNHAREAGFTKIIYQDGNNLIVAR